MHLMASVVGFLFLLCMLLFSKVASAQTVIIPDDIDQISAAPYTTLLEDPNHTLTIEQVISPAYNNQFKVNQTGHLNLGYSKSTWWLKLKVKRQTLQSWYALIDFPILPRVDAFLIPVNSDKLINLGNMRKEFVFQRLPMMRLPENIEHFTLYIRVNNNGEEILLLPLQLISADALSIKTAKDYLFYGGIISGLVVLIFYNLFLYISLRNPTYFSLVILLISLVLIIQRAANVIPWLSIFSNPLSFYYPLIFQILAISSIQFWRQATEINRLFPRSDKAIRIIQILMIAQIPFLQILPYPDAWIYIITTVIIFVVGTFCFLAIFKKSRIMPSLALPLFIYIGGAIPALLWGMGFLIHANIPLMLFHACSLLSAVLLSITLAEHTRQLRLQAERAKTESKAKDSFLTTMSHELRTPMHAVTSVVHLFKSTPLSDQQKIHLNKLEISSDHMLNLINKILDLGFINSTEFNLETRHFRLDETLQQIGQLIAEEAKQKQLRFSIENHAPLPGKLLVGDSTRLKQVLLNLLYNGIKFTDKGSVTLIVENTTGAHLPDNTISLQFRVTDTGIGIPKKQHKSIFNAFSQADNSTRRKYGGSGLGLTISHKLVDQMGGTLQLNSAPAEGSSFFFSLDFLLLSGAVSRTIPAATVRATSNGQDKITVMLVDDVELNRFLGGELITILGHSVITAKSGEEAIELLGQQTVLPIDLVLMDVSMPDMDGYETTQQIRSKARFANLPIVALTAHAIEGERERCLDAGMDDYLSKPFELEQLQEKIQQWTANKVS